MTTTFTPPTGKRWKGHQLRKAVIEAAEAMLDDGRPKTIEVPNVTIREVLEAHPEFPRSSVYRIFESEGPGPGDQLANFHAQIEVTP